MNSNDDERTYKQINTRSKSIIKMIQYFLFIFGFVQLAKL